MALGALVTLVLTVTRALDGHTPGTVLTSTRAVEKDSLSAPGLPRQFARTAVLVLLHVTVVGPAVAAAFSQGGRDWIDRLVGTGVIAVDPAQTVPKLTLLRRPADRKPPVSTTPRTPVPPPPASREDNHVPPRPTEVAANAALRTAPHSPTPAGISTRNAPQVEPAPVETLQSPALVAVGGAAPTPAPAPLGVAAAPVLAAVAAPTHGTITSVRMAPARTATRDLPTEAAPERAPAVATAPIPTRRSRAARARTRPAPQAFPQSTPGVAPAPPTRDGTPTHLLPTSSRSISGSVTSLPSTFRMLPADQWPQRGSSWSTPRVAASAHQDALRDDAPTSGVLRQTAGLPVTRDPDAPVSWGAEPPTTPGLWVVADSGQRERVDTMLLIGRSPSSSDPSAKQVVVPDTTRTLSRTHFAIGPTKKGAWVEDSFSANGTRLRSPSGRTVALPRGKRIEVPIGTVVIAGERQFTLVSDAPR
ncbi:hypothetical protein I6B53_01395 [Schaalia sp. 19OD2882]|uniref:FHA domain-containing protein n=1 Tax=Schaalia sp. 19OD2882 TaxID=2794089 RepID=UPI001C1EB80F|nr:FHA domain-containing protein [Schaalia sp. 19OD2882]QWW19816.1 hypothetical protein I6B53_01395 [Schaalia sp. 19OD2882]